MEALSLSEAKMKLSSLVDRVNTRDEEIVITKNGRPAAILISPDEFEGWKETFLLRSDPGFLKALINGIRALKQENARLYTLEELFET